MSGKERKRTLILGIGSDFGDDQLGLVVARELAAKLPRCHVQGLRSPLDLCNHVADAGELHIVDACRGAGLPGTLFCQAWPSPALQEVQFSGTHDVELVAALMLAERLVRLPSRVFIWSIEAGGEEQAYPHSMQAHLSPMVATAVGKLIARIVAEVNRTEALGQEPAGHA